MDITLKCYLIINTAATVFVKGCLYSDLLLPSVAWVWESTEGCMCDPSPSIAAANSHTKLNWSPALPPSSRLFLREVIPRSPLLQSSAVCHSPALLLPSACRRAERASFTSSSRPQPCLSVCRLHSLLCPCPQGAPHLGREVPQGQTPPPPPPPSTSSR